MAVRLPSRDSIVWTVGLISAVSTYIYQHHGALTPADIAALAGVIFAWMKTSPAGWFNQGK